jgi:hypothetical protein
MESADPALVRAHKDGSAKPDESDLRFDMREGPDSMWNSAVIDILVKKVQKAHKKSRYVIPERSRAYFLDLVQDKFKRARRSWKRGQAQLTEADVLETPEEVEARLVADKTRRLMNVRTRERRVQVSELSFAKAVIEFPVEVPTPIEHGGGNYRLQRTRGGL